MRRGNRTMSSKTDKHSNCPSCARRCEEAQDKSIRLEKKVFVMTIALTSALTLLGEKAVQEIIAIVRGVQGITESAQGESDSSQDAKPADDTVGAAPRTRPFERKPTGESESPVQAADGAESESNVMGISDPRKSASASQLLVDTVNGKVPSMGELVFMPTVPPPAERKRDTADNDPDDGNPYLDSYVPDLNARFVTESPFGGYPTDGSFGAVPIPSPAAIAVLGIVPLLGRRQRN